MNQIQNQFINIKEESKSDSINKEKDISSLNLNSFNEFPKDIIDMTPNIEFNKEINKQSNKYFFNNLYY
jgi:hypothetical protein